MTYTNPDKYFNRFDPAKNYSKLLFLAGSGLQGAELNELQESIRNDLKEILNKLVTNGTILTGGEVSGINDTSIIMKAATVYLDGYTARVEDRVVPIVNTGTIFVGIASKRVLITELEDPSIVEPDPASPNVGQPGAMRERLDARWVNQSELTGDESFFPIIKIVNGVIETINRQTDDISSIFNKILNQYDNEIRGSTILYGINITYDSMDAAESAILHVSSGKARIKGTPVVIESQQILAMDPVSETRSAQGEPYTYAGTATYNLRYNKISQVTRVQGTKRITRTITHGAFSGAIDVLPDIPVLNVESVSQGSTVYKVNTDYIVSGDSINWSPNGAEPSPGSTYTVTYTYISTFIPSISSDGKGIVLDATNSLVNGSVFYVDYKYYLRRIDRISLTSNKQFIISKGTPGYTTYNPPSYIDGALSLATVELIRGQDAKVKMDTVYNVSISDMNIIKSRIAYLEENVSTLSLLEEARSSDPTLMKRNIFVDNLKSTAQQDLGLTNNLRIFGESLILDSKYDRLGVTTDSYYLPFTEIPAISQTAFTNSQKVNPYAVAGNPPLGLLQLIPDNISQSTVWYDRRAVASAAGGLWGRDIWGSIANILANTDHSGRTQWGTQNGEELNINTTQNEMIQCKLFGFEANETVTLTYRSIRQDIQSDSNGSVVYNLNVPAGTPNGNYEVKAVGQTSRTIASAVLKVISTARTEIVYYDPIAETFVLPEDADLTSLQIYVTELPDDDIIAKVGDAEYGIPVSNTYSESGRIAKNDIVNGWNKIKFNEPNPVTKGDERAIILLTSQPKGSVGTAKIGNIDKFTNKPVISQPYDGVFQVSANESTYTPYQDEDLTFILNKAVYNVQSQTFTLITMNNLVGVSDWILSPDAIYIPSGTSARFYLEDTLGNQYDIPPGQPMYCVPLSGTVKLKATLSSTSINKSPILTRGITLYGGSSVKPGTYTSRQFDIEDGSNKPATLKLIINQYTPAGSTFQPSIQLANGSFESMKYVSSVPVGDGWLQATYTYENLASNSSRLRLTLDKTDYTVTPIIRDIRLIIS